MSADRTASARAALDLVGKTVRPRPGTERYAFANGHPRTGLVVDVDIYDLDHPYAKVLFGTETDLIFPFELDVVEGK